MLLVTSTFVSFSQEIETEKKQTYKVSLLLPLFLDTIQPFNDVDTTNVKLSQVNKNAVLGIELFQGIKYAFDSLAQETGSNFILNISDTKQSEESLKAALASPNFYDADLAIGPVYNNMLKVATEQAKKYNIPLVSPLSPAENLTSENRRFFMVNPGIKAHLNTMLDFAKNEYGTENILIVRQGNEKEYAAYLKRNIGNAFNYKELVYSGGKYTNTANKEFPATELKIHLKANGYNVFLVPSIDLQFAHKLSRELFNIAAEYPVIVIGLPIWSPENDLRLDYLEKINTHFTQAAYINDSMFHNAVFAQRFFELYGQYPTETNIKGFDIAYFFGKQLIQHGKDFYKTIEEAEGTSIHTTFKFKEAYSEGSMQEETMFLYYENKHVHLFKLEEYMLKKMR